MATASESMSSPRRDSARHNGAGGSAVSQRKGLAQKRMSQADAHQMNRALGWFSLGLGFVEILAPRSLGRLIGAGDHPGVMRLCGLREIASGVSLLTERVPASSAISRVAGDAMDLALLGVAMRSPDARPRRLAAAATAVLGVTAIDAYSAGQQSRASAVRADESVPVKVSVAINSTPKKIYDFWRNLENLPRFMDHLESVTQKDERTSHWVVSGPGGVLIEWDAEVTEDQPATCIAWRTLPSSEVQHSGRVRFEAGGRGTIVHVEMEYGAPAGRLSGAVAKLLSADPKSRIRQALRALKQLLEAGEIATTAGQPAGRRSLVGQALTRRES